MTDTIVNVEQGQLRGKVLTLPGGREIYAFLGIPYAKPPVGELRFRAPLPPDNWTGIRDAIAMGNSCVQRSIISKEYTGAEDCLFLNIYTPNIKKDDSKYLPVMLFIHGGGFVEGSGDSASVTPDQLVDKDVVLVSINYRLGILGFLALGIPEASGNMGLKDQVQALRWVQQNIKHFNGDASNVTIFGESAGGVSVEYLVLSPMAKGLFHKAIAQSGSTLSPCASCSNSEDLAFKISKKFRKNIDNVHDLTIFLKEVPSEDLVKLSYEVLELLKSEPFMFPFLPSVEQKIEGVDPFITEDPFKIMTEGSFNKVPMMVGFCSHESYISESLEPGLIESIESGKKHLTDFVSAKLPIHKLDNADNVLYQIYVERTNSESDMIPFDFVTDVTFLGVIYVATKLLSKVIRPIYFYEFAYDGNLNVGKIMWNINRKGTCHGDELGYINCPFIEGVWPSTKHPKPSDSDILMRKKMSTMWTNFAKYGNPTPVLDDTITIKWDPIEANQFKYLHIDIEQTMKTNLFPERMKIFEDAYFGK